MKKYGLPQDYYLRENISWNAKTNTNNIELFKSIYICSCRFFYFKILNKLEYNYDYDIFNFKGRDHQRVYFFE